MDKIEFSHNYTKLPDGIKTAVLIAAEPIRREEQTHLFLWQDTHYLDEIGVERWAPFPDKDNYLCLVLKSDSGAIFTTLRKDNEENRYKYMDLKCAGVAGMYWQPKYKRVFEIIIKEG